MQHRIAQQIGKMWLVKIVSVLKCNLNLPLMTNDGDEIRDEAIQGKKRPNSESKKSMLEMQTKKR